MTKGYTMEVLRRVYDDDNGACIQVAPGSDGFGIRVNTPDPTSSDYWGAIDFCITKEMAKLLGEALIASAEEIEE